MYYKPLSGIPYRFPFQHNAPLCRTHCAMVKLGLRYPLFLLGNYNKTMW